MTAWKERPLCEQCGKPVKRPVRRFCSPACSNATSGAKTRAGWIERFWSQVDKGGPVIYPELGPCWIWTGAKYNADGYGSASRDGRLAAAHRVSYEMANGPIPDGLLACHHCDNPPCVNPDHIYAGTYSDNARDMHERGRARRTWAAVE